MPKTEAGATQVVTTITLTKFADGTWDATRFDPAQQPRRWGEGSTFWARSHPSAEAALAALIEVERESESPCDAVLWHGPGHQSSTRCTKTGAHDVHECVYGSDRQFAQWRTGDYTNKLREQGIEFDPESYPENIGMTGFFDEPPQDDGED